MIVADRYFALTVLLDKNIHSDDAEAIIKAIREMKRVHAVVPHASNLTKARKKEGELKIWRYFHPGYPEETD